MANNAVEQAFSSWKEHSNNTRVDTGLAIQELLRHSYPNHHVTRTQPLKCDLLGFAKAGFATATAQDGPAHYVATRAYRSPGPRLEKKPGKLGDEVQFGRWRYEFGGSELVLYEVNYADHYGRTIRLLYVLAPRRTDAEPGNQLHHPATDALLLAAGEWTRELHGEIYVFDDAEWIKDKTLYQSVQDASWDDVVLNPAMKAKLMNDVQSFFDNRDIYRSMKVAWKRGVILHGLPGNGKTMSIKALINALSRRPEPIPSLYVKSFDACQGPKWSIQSIFSHARNMAPCLLIFEDLDSLVEEETRSYFLNEVDGLESNEGILMIGSTNHLDRLDAAITKRPSRFDRKYHFRLPDEAERAAYCRYWSQKFTGPIDTGAGAGAGAGGIAAEVDFVEDLCPLIAKMTEGFSFAYLKELFITSLLLLAHANADKNDENDTEQDGEKPAPSHRETTVTPRKKSSWWPSWSRGLLRQPTINKAAVDIEAVGKIKKRDGPSKKGKNGIPAVDIPKHLADHKLLGIVKLQAEVLLEEMDNTGEEEEVENQKSGSFGRLHRIRQRQYDSDDD